MKYFWRADVVRQIFLEDVSVGFINLNLVEWEKITKFIEFLDDKFYSR